MNPLKSVFHSDGTFGMEQQIGNMRYDFTQPGEPPTFVTGQQGNMRTVIRPDGTPAMEWNVGNMRYASDKQGFDYIP